MWPMSHPGDLQPTQYDTVLQIIITPKLLWQILLAIKTNWALRAALVSDFQKIHRNFKLLVLTGSAQPSSGGN